MRKELIQVEHLLDLIKKLKQMPGGETLDVRQSLSQGVAAINSVMFHREQMPLLPVDVTGSQQQLEEQLEVWLGYQKAELQIRKEISTKTDYDFRVLMQHVKYSTKQSLVEESKACLNNFRAWSNNAYQQMLKTYNKFSNFWGKIDLDKNELELIEDRMGQLKEHWEDFCWLYDELGDYRSKKVLYGILRCWMTFEFDIKNEIRENNFSDYYDFDLVSCDKNEVFVDLGAYTGDSAGSFIENYGAYKRIYCYEITPATMETMKENLKEHDQIIYRNVGVGKEKGVMYLSEPERVDSANRLSKENGYEVEVVALDEDISEKITFIKMDIEGAELDAIEGAQRHIREEQPKMTVCTYHNNWHIWAVPRKLREYNPEYKLYMRYNGAYNAFLISEFVIFAL